MVLVLRTEKHAISNEPFEALFASFKEQLADGVLVTVAPHNVLQVFLGCKCNVFICFYISQCVKRFWNFS